MSKHIFVLWNNTNEKFFNIIYENISKSDALNEFENNYGFDNFSIINIISL